MITRILVDKDGKYYYQHDNKDVSTHLGRVPAATLAAVVDGTQVLSDVHEKFIIISPTWLDHYRRMTRGPQIMLLKDLGVVAAETGVGPESIIGEAGTGSGAAACYFARHVKRVYSFDVVPEHVEIGRGNAKSLGLTNITFATHDVYESVPAPEEEAYDMFLLDNPEPWKALPHLRGRIRIGGWVVGYMPSINQTAEFANALQAAEGFQYRKTVELIEREWAVKGMRVRPSSDAIGHTGFLVFARRIA